MQACAPTPAQVYLWVVALACTCGPLSGLPSTLQAVASIPLASGTGGSDTSSQVRTAVAAGAHMHELPLVLACAAVATNVYASWRRVPVHSAHAWCPCRVPLLQSTSRLPTLRSHRRRAAGHTRRQCNTCIHAGHTLTVHCRLTSRMLGGGGRSGVQRIQWWDSGAVPTTLHSDCRFL
jgi:hypothetical protein